MPGKQRLIVVAVVFGQPHGQDANGVASDGRVALSAALAVAAPVRAGVELDVSAGQGGQLRDAQPGPASQARASRAFAASVPAGAVLWVRRAAPRFQDSWSGECHHRPATLRGAVFLPTRASSLSGSSGGRGAPRGDLGAAGGCPRRLRSVGSDRQLEV
jgi:hypothetical protein